MHDVPPDVEFADRGAGPAILMLPGSFGTGAGWKAVIENLGGKFRIVTTSLLGYGATSERRRPGQASMRPQTDVIDAILATIGEPAHVVAHSFGGLAALAHALQGRIKPASLTLVEANPFGILSTAGEAELYAMFGAMTKIYFAEIEAGERDAARHVIDFYGGDGTFAAFPAKVRDYVIRTTPSNVLDWACGTAFEPSLSDYQTIVAPTLIVRGGDGHPAMKRIAELLAAAVPDARLETVAGGSHFLPATHPAEIARLIEAHVKSRTA